MEDILRLTVRTAPPAMTGSVDAHHVVRPARRASRDVIDKLRLSGTVDDC